MLGNKKNDMIDGIADATFLFDGVNCQVKMYKSY